MPEIVGSLIKITGIVQGVGFRPFVYGLAGRFGLTGTVRNTSAGVEILADGRQEVLDSFVRALREQAPPLAVIDQLEVANRPKNGYTSFEICHSTERSGAFQPVSPDIGLCPDCLRELFDPGDRRYRYPFINCTQCGPRFTIIQDVPYDRPWTTMAPFDMCPECAAEYRDPENRRFHAQPVACPDCGPRVWLERPDPAEETVYGGVAIQAVRELLAGGKIVALKSLGGFHLACDAADPAAVTELRRRKLRPEKPFATMMADLATVSRYCHISKAERELLQSRQRPIVLLERLPGSPLAGELAPGRNTLGVMLPYTPLHYLLLEHEAGKGEVPPVLVMTSGNLSAEPIAHTNAQARSCLGALADAFMLNDRGIHVRCDDSVVRVVSGLGPARLPEKELVFPMRRSRGYAPSPLHFPWSVSPLLATGAELKNTFCLARERYAFLSHHIGSIQNLETLSSFQEGIAHYESLFRIRPQILAYDLHPDYEATRYALDRADREGLPAYGIQHHHAHVAACMTEHGLPSEKTVIGVSFDGTGYGLDGTIWGGEFLVAGYADFQRHTHLAAVPLPGGEAAVRAPWRMALAWLRQAGIPWEQDLPPVQHALQEVGPTGLNILRRQIERGLNAPPTSSVGRLFDAVAALLDIRQQVNYEAQAAIELEACIDPDECGRYSLETRAATVDPSPMFAAMVRDLRAGHSAGRLAAKFHNTLAAMVLDVCRSIRKESGCSAVALSGGVWSNAALLRLTVPSLQRVSFEVYLHRLVPANDGGLALGQAAIASIRHALQGGGDVPGYSR